MASLARNIRLLPNVKTKWAVTYQITRNYWNKDWKPGKFPETPEEREAAAKKYGLLPEQYEPYPDDGTGWGDYPKLPDISSDAKDPYYPWDFPEHRRNFNETMHADFDMYAEEKYDISLKPRYSVTTQILSFLAVFGSIAGLYYFLDDKKMFRPVLPKQYPSSGVHYSFEPAN